jgi:hypothetical protein
VLEITERWELFARGDTSLVRIQLAIGRVTTVRIPGLSSGGSAYLVVGTDRALVRRLDFVPTYVVPDAGAPREGTGLFAESGPAFPGPEPDQVWVPTEADQSLALVWLGGGGPIATARVPPGGKPGRATADGAGYVLFDGVDGYYVARPDGWQRISAGWVFATGRTGWLAFECDDQGHCAVVNVARGTGARQVVPGVVAYDVLRGLISPDGATAALLEDDRGTVGLRLVELPSGRRHDVAVAVAKTVNQVIAWSPDSRWLFVVDVDGALLAVDRTDGQVRALPLLLPPLRQVAVRDVGR